MPDNNFYGLEHFVDGSKIGDKIVLGRPLRSYTPTEFATYNECVEFEGRVYDAVSVGDALQHIISEEFGDAFYKHRNAFIQLDEDNRQRELLHARIKHLMGEHAPYTVLKTLTIAHTGWESDNQYALIRVGDTKHWVGTDHGSPKLYDEQHIRECLNELEEQTKAIRDALSLS